jgi:site-specific recombinase XerD
MSEPTIILRKNKQLKNGSYPLAIQICKDYKETVVHIGVSVMAEDWDEEKSRVRKSHPNSTRINNLIKHRLANASDTKIELETDTPDVSVLSIRQKLKPKVGATFFPQAQAYLDDLKAAGNYNVFTADKPRINHFREFLKNEDIPLKDVTVGCLKDYTVWLHARRTTTKAGKTKRLSERTVMNHLSVIRSVLSYARAHDVIDDRVNPFGRRKIVIRFPDSKKEGLNAEEVDLLEKVELPDPRHHHARNKWLLAFYFAGIRVSDVFRLQWTDFRDGRLYYNMGKNDKGDSLKIPPKAQAILDQYEQYKESDDDFVFPELKGVDPTNEFVTKRTIAFATSYTDNFLKRNVAPPAGITKKLTMHIARHTFARLAGKTIPIKTLQKLYRHKRLATTAEYQQNFDHDEADYALDAVLNSMKPTNPQPA